MAPGEQLAASLQHANRAMKQFIDTWEAGWRRERRLRFNARWLWFWRAYYR